MSTTCNGIVNGVGSKAIEGQLNGKTITVMKVMALMTNAYVPIMAATAYQV